MTTIIFAHPKHESFNGRILRSLEEFLKEADKTYTLIDLYKDGFSPALTAQELDGFYNGISYDPLVKQYQDVLLNTESLILLFPIWWNEYPAIIKGFFDRVCLGKFAFEYTQGGVKSKLTHIKKSLVLTTSHAPTEVLKHHSGDVIENQVINHMLKGIGIADNKWINYGNILDSGENEQTSYIESLKPIIIGL